MLGSLPTSVEWRNLAIIEFPEVLSLVETPGGTVSGLDMGRVRV